MAGKGGKRPGSGRPRKPITDIRRGLLVLKKAAAADVLAEVDEIAAWKSKLLSLDERVSLQALIYLTDRRDGRAAYTVNANITGLEGLAERIEQGRRRVLEGHK